MVIYGTCDIYGISVVQDGKVYICDTSGKSDIYGISMVRVISICRLQVICMVHVWYMYGISMVYVWCMYGKGFDHARINS